MVNALAGGVPEVHAGLSGVAPALVWGPAAIYFFATGGIWRGVFLIGFGTLIVGIVDNLLQPILIGREIKMPDDLVLLATLGGSPSSVWRVSWRVP